MNTFDQVPLHPSDFAENPEDRCPVLLLLDTSLSMQGAKIDALNQGLQQLHAELLEDKLAAKRVEIGIVGFGPVRVVSDFQSVNQALMPTLVAEGNTPMGAAIAMGLELLKTRKATIRSHGLNVYRPWVFMITDGESDPSEGRSDWRGRRGVGVPGAWVFVASRGAVLGFFSGSRLALGSRSGG
ncbi:MAG: VWA domain-containing protein [Xanthomonadales bacterium]|nr:VWA domain-containing protein [Xanthomonadales bacterium]